MGGISGSASRGYSKSQSTTTGEEAGREFTQRLSGEDQENLRGLIAGFGKGASTDDQGAVRRNAIKDSKGVVRQIFQEFSEQALPQIADAQNAGGGFSSTTGQLLANDAFARANSQASGVVLEHIAKSADRDQQNKALDIQGLQVALQSLLGAQESSNFSSEFKTQSNSRSATRNYGVTGSI